MVKGQIFFSGNIADLKAMYGKRKKSHVVFICDTNTEKHCLPFLDKPDGVIIIPPGETSKTNETYIYILDELAKFNTGRSSLIINLGGGVVTDIGGFAASTYMRGIDFVNIPTTLTGMVDAAIGGKTGIDFRYRKNFIGTFALPESILIFPGFLDTLPKDEKQSGIAEMIKTGIVANRSLFEKLNREGSVDDLIQMAAETKHGIVERDPFDKEERQILNFGHTIGHAYESYRLKIGNPVLHGFAVAVGMMAEARIAHSLDMIAGEELNRILDCIALHFQLNEISHSEFESIREFILMDKKNSENKIMFSLPSGMGSCKIKIPVDMAHIKSVLFNA